MLTVDARVGFVRRLVVALALTALVVGATTAVAGAAAESPKAWAKDVCVGVGDWSSAIEKAVAKVKVDAAASPAAIKKALSKLLKRAIGATDTLAGSLDDAGQPKVPKGKDAAEALQDGIDDALAAFRAARTELKKVSTAEATAFATAAVAVETSLDAALTKVQTVFESASAFGSAKLLKAFTKEPACKKLVATS